jgi:hypothetical protein
MSGTPPVADYQALMDLAGRIHGHLATHPKDPQALDDLHYVVGMLKGGATQAANAQDMAAAVGPQTAQPGPAIRAGLTQAAVDLPKGFLNTLLHPVQAAGQFTGLGNVGKAWDVFHDPEAQPGEKLDAILRATPANLGYAPERALLETTGVKSDTPASLTDQAHAAGNVASLALLGVNRNTPGVRLMGRVVGKLPLVGPLSRAAGDVLQRYGKPGKPTMDPAVAAGLRDRIAQPLGGPLEDIGAAQADRAAGKITEQEFNTAMEMASRRVNAPPAGSLMSLEAPAFTRGPVPLSVEAMQGRAGIPTSAARAEALRIQSPLEQLGKGRTLPYYPKGGQAEQTLPPPSVQSPPVIGPASPEVMVRQTPYAQLMEALQQPGITARIRQAILQELQRRGIVGTGLLAPR